MLHSWMLPSTRRPPMLGERTGGVHAGRYSEKPVGSFARIRRQCPRSSSAEWTKQSTWLHPAIERPPTAQRIVSKFEAHPPDPGATLRHRVASAAGPPNASAPHRG